MNDAQLAFNLRDGAAAKAAGLDQVDASHADFVPQMREAAKAWARTHGQVTADDLRQIAVALHLQPRHKNAWGAIIRGRGWRVIGRRRSELATNHGHVNPVWTWDDESAEADA